MTATRKRNQLGSVIVHRRQCDMPARILKLRAGCLGKFVHTSLGHELDAARITTELSPRAGDSIRSDDGRQTPRNASERLMRHAERVDGRDISFAASLAPGDYSPKGIHAAMSAVARTSSTACSLRGRSSKNGGRRETNNARPGWGRVRTLSHQPAPETLRVTMG